MISVLLFATVLSILIVVHEWGHFYVAKRLGIRVERFSIGFGPKLLGLQKGETEYRLSLFPVGGYVKLAGETPEEGLRGEKWEYLSRSVGERFAVVFAGPFLNYLLAFFVFTAVFVIGNPQLTSKIGEVKRGYPAEEAGLLKGDRVVSIDGRGIRFWDEVIGAIHETSEAQSLRLAVERQGKEIVFNVRPKEVEEKDLFGEKKRFALIGISHSEEVVSVKYPLHRALSSAAKQQAHITTVTLKALVRMITGHLPLKESLTGPIGIFMITDQAARLGLAYLLQIVALLSTSLAIFNVLPIPALDGGHLFFLSIERLKGKPVSERVQELSRQVGMAFLLMLMLVVFYNDFSRFKVFEKLSGWFGGF